MFLRPTTAQQQGLPEDPDLLGPLPGYELPYPEYNDTRPPFEPFQPHQPAMPAPLFSLGFPTDLADRFPEKPLLERPPRKRPPVAAGLLPGGRPRPPSSNDRALPKPGLPHQRPDPASSSSHAPQRRLPSHAHGATAVSSARCSSSATAAPCVGPPASGGASPETGPQTQLPLPFKKTSAGLQELLERLPGHALVHGPARPAQPGHLGRLVCQSEKDA